MYMYIYIYLCMHVAGWETTLSTANGPRGVNDSQCKTNGACIRFGCKMRIEYFVFVTPPYKHSK